ESNTYNTPQSTSNMAYVYLNTYTTGSTSSNSDSVTLTDVAVSGLRPLNMNFNLNYQNSCATQGPVPNEADRKLNITIQNLTNSSQANIIQNMNGTTGTTLGIGNSVALTIDDVYNGEYYFNLTANNNYQITINLYYVCLYGQLSFTYPDTTAQIAYVNKKTGGLRVSKTTNYDNNNVQTSLKKYYYASKNNLSTSSGEPSLEPYYFSTFTVAGECSVGGAGGSCAPWRIDYLRLNSGALNAMYRSSLQNTRYEYVTVSESNSGFANGGIEYKFKLAPMFNSTLILGTYSEIYSEGQMSWGDGLELERISFKHNGSS